MNGYKKIINMGTYYHSYLGCYLEIPIVNQPVTHTVYKNNLNQIVDSQFNPETGEKHTQDTIIKNEQIYPDRYIEHREDLDEDAFFIPYYLGGDKNRIFIPNSSNDNLIIHNSEYDYIQELTLINPDKEIIKFKRKYNEYISEYKKLYPALQIKFGIIRYGM